ncbi:MAG: hypothetical protein Q9207_003965 [Kuettlingeria erythrocarpa]
MDWQTWSSLPQNRNFAADLSDKIFREWPKKLGARHFNAVGLRFDMPPVIQGKACKSPTSFARHPALLRDRGLIPSDHRTDGVSELRRPFAYHHSSGQKASGQEHAAQFNSILACTPQAGAVDGSLLESAFSSNFINELVSKQSDDIIHGLWTLRYSRIFEGVILPRLAVLLEAIEISSERPQWADQEFTPEYSLVRDFGAGPDDGGPQATCRFERGVGRLDAGSDKLCYSWGKQTSSVTTETKDAAGRQGDIHRALVDRTSFDVLRCHLDQSTKYRPNRFLFQTSRFVGMVGQEAWRAQIHTLDSLAYYPKQGGTVEDNITVEFEGQQEQGYFGIFETEHQQAFEEFVKQKYLLSIYAVLNRVKENLAESLMKLPESAWFQFYSPIFNSAGDLIAAIVYKAYARKTACSPRRQDIIRVAPPIATPRARSKTPPPRPPPAKMTTKVSWTHTVTLTLDRTRLALVLTGVNETPSPLSFGYIEAIFSSGRKGEHNLFSALKFPYQKNTVKLVRPTTASLEVGPTNQKERFKATVNGFVLAPGESIELVIDGSTAAGNGEFEIEVLEAWKDVESGSYAGNGMRTIVVLVQ